MGVLIAYSSSAHRNLDLLPTREVPRPHDRPRGPFTFLRCCVVLGVPGLPGRPLHVPAQLLRSERTGTSRDPEGPRERPAPERQIAAGEAGMQVRTPAGQRTAKIGDAFALDHHHTQQVGLGRSSPAPHAGALGAGWVTCAARHRLSLPPRVRFPLAGGDDAIADTDGGVFPAAGPGRTASAHGGAARSAAGVRRPRPPPEPCRSPHRTPHRASGRGGCRCASR